jgi:hypothetical protein
VRVTTLASLEILVSETNSTESHSGHLSDDLKDVRFHLIRERSLLAIGIQIEVARLKYLLSCTLHVDSLVIARFSRSIVLCDCRHSLSLRGEVEADKVLWQVNLSDLLIALSELFNELKHGLLGS